MKKGKSLRILLPLALVVLLLVSLPVTGVLASLVDSTAVIENKFEPAKVVSVVDAASADDDASNYIVRNAGTIPSLVRVKLIVNWVDAEGRVIPAPEGASYTLEKDDSWTEIDEYYYYDAILPVSGYTTPVVKSVSSEGGTLQVRMLVDMVQATPAEAVKDSWGVSYNNGLWS